MRMRETIGHENVARFFGISEHNDTVFLVEELCANGTLMGFMRSNKYSVNESFRYVACPPVNIVTSLRRNLEEQQGPAVASIARDDLSTLPGDDPFPRARMHRDRNAR